MYEYIVFVIVFFIIEKSIIHSISKMMNLFQITNQNIVVNVLKTINVPAIRLKVECIKQSIFLIFLN